MVLKEGVIRVNYKIISYAGSLGNIANKKKGVQYH